MVMVMVMIMITTKMMMMMMMMMMIMQNSCDDFKSNQDVNYVTDIHQRQ